MRLRLAFILFAALALAVAGCGGSSKKSAAPTTETTVTETATTETTAPTTGASTSPSFASSKNCLQLANLGASVSQAMAASGGKNDLGTQAKFFEEFAAKTPSEIRSDFQVIAKAFSTYLSAYQHLNLTPGATPTPKQIAELTKITSAFSQPAVQKASAHIEAWTKKNCGTP